MIELNDATTHQAAMPLTSKIEAYDPSWPEHYLAMTEWLRPLLGASLLNLQHVGSTAVFGLAAKPEIDVLATVIDLDEINRWTIELARMGFRRGGNLSDDHLFFKRDVNCVRTHKLHICVDGHFSAARMIQFRDHLRRSPADRDRYAAFKLMLEAQNERGIAEYLARKAPFIDEILSRSYNPNEPRSS